MDTVKMTPPMPDEPKCPQCGTPLPSGALAGLCPACLLKLGAAADSVTDANQKAFVPPSVAELAPLFPQLEILELIGKGGMGAVYKARQKQLDRIVALKILPPGIGNEPAFAERFAREAKALAKLNHPNIVTLYEFGDAGGQFYFLMEFVDGVNLRQLLHAGRVSAREALAIVPQICDALQFAHDQGIVHRDIKPENILLDRRGRVKVADFGLAKIMGGDDKGPAAAGDTAAGSTSLTDAGKVMGTPQYMSPEQIQAPGEVDHRADIYALGVVFYQMLTGELPGKKLEAPSKKVQIDVRLDEIVLRALEKKPELRYQQVSQVKTCVETIVATPDGNKAETGETNSSTPPRPVIHARKKTKGEFTGIGCAIQAIGLGCFFIPYIGPVLGIVLLIIGGRMALKLVCSGCGQRTDGDAAKCSHCNAEFQGARFSYTAIMGALGIPVPVVVILAALLEMTRRDISSSPHFNFPPIVVFFSVAFCLTTTIGGWIAVAQIRRSAGKLYGMGLAVFDGLLFPLFALDCVIGWLINNVFWMLHFRPGINMENSAMGLVWLVIIVVCIVVDGLIIWLVWRAVNKPGTTNTIPLPAVESWLALMDNGNYAQSWEAGSRSFRWAVTKGDWMEALEKVRRPLGKIISRKLISTKYSALGYRFDAKFESSFDGLKSTAETLVFTRQWNGEWKPAGYLIGHIARHSQALRRLKKFFFFTVPVAILFTLIVRAYFLQPFHVMGGGVEPEIPIYSRILVWKFHPHIAPGDIIAHWHNYQVWVSRVVSADDSGVVVSRNGQPDETIPNATVLGKVVTVYWRASGRAAVASASGDASQLAQEGWQLWQAGKLDEATIKFQQAIKLAPDDANAWNGLGWATFNSGHNDAAEKAFQKTVSIVPNHPAALNGLGQIYLAERKYDTAEKFLLQAAPKAPAAWFGLARLYLLEGKFEQAEKYAQDIVDSGQADETAKKMLEAARAKHLSDGLRMMIEPPAAAPNLSFGPVMERVIEPGNPAHRALNLAFGNFIEPGPGRPLDFSASGTNSLRAAGVDLYAADNELTPGMLSTLDLRLCVGIYPQGGDGQNVNLDNLAPEQLQSVLDEMEKWRSNMETIHTLGLDLRRATGNISGTNLYFFITRNDVRGVLQITGFTENPRGVKIRYKLVQSAEPKPATAQNLSFGPVKEWVLPSGWTNIVNLDSGQIVNQLPKNKHDRCIGFWYSDEGSLVIFHGGVVALDADGTWDLTDTIQTKKLVEDIRSSMILSSGVGLSDNRLPRTFLIKTRDDTIGLLQITGFTENPRGVKIRYKLVQAYGQASHSTDPQINTNPTTISFKDSMVVVTNYSAKGKSVINLKSLPLTLADGQQLVLTGSNMIVVPVSEPADLREARAKLAELRVNYAEQHPMIQKVQARIKELERMTKEEPAAPADLREAKAHLAELRVDYPDLNPRIQEALARIKALEGK